MGKDLSDCDTYNPQDENMHEPEEDDFFKEVVENSLKTKKTPILRKSK